MSVFFIYKKHLLTSLPSLIISSSINWLSIVVAIATAAAAAVAVTVIAYFHHDILTDMTTDDRR